MRANRVHVSGLPLAALIVLAPLLLAAAQRSGDTRHTVPAKTPEAPGKAATNSCKACVERAVVLDPNLFASGYEPEVRLAYEAAKKYPDLIDRIHCFCECRENDRFHHKTLLTCFTEQHAAACGICQQEAIMAAKMKQKGASDDEVEITVESLHKTDGHPPTFGRGR